MAKYLEHNGSGDAQEVQAVAVSQGAPSAGKIAQLNAAGQWDESFMPTGFAPDKQAFLASEAIPAGRYVNIYDNAGTPTIRLADGNTVAKKAWGYATAAIAANQTGSIMFDDLNGGLTGLTTGDVYLSATTPGGVTSTPPTGAGKIVQRLGVATSATTIHTSIQNPIILAA